MVVESSSPPVPVLIHLPKRRFLQARADVHAYLAQELDVSRLNRIHRHLWLAGLPGGARPLHRQRLIGRDIFVTEQTDLHLVWTQSRIFIKPLPAFILTRKTWIDHLCADLSLYRSGCGLLLSYASLVCHPSDLRLAQSLHLLPGEIEYEAWLTFIDDFLRHIEYGTDRYVNPRYVYGELRLSRLNWIHRLSPEHFSLGTFPQSYFQGPTWYTPFLVNNFGWLVVAFAYVAIVLSAMQVGLATERLARNDRFQNVSYGFAVFSITMPVIGVSVIIAASVVVSLFHVLATLKYDGERRNKSPIAFAPIERGETEVPA